MPCEVGTDVQRAAEVLKSGGLVAFPTETVYGLGGNALDVHAVARIFEVKGRPRFDPLIVHIADALRLDDLASYVPAAARTLADRFWPGPLTLVLPKTAAVPDLVTSGLPTVAARIPNHPMALELLRTAGLPVAAPSANPFGRLSPTRAEHVAEQLGEKIDYILDGGPCQIGVESTVLQLCGPAPLLLRPGGLPLEAIEAVIGPVALPETSEAAAAAPLAPGMLPKHYAPRTPLVVEPNAATLADFMKTQADFVARIGARRSPPRIGLLTLSPIRDAGKFAVVEVLSETGDLTEAAANFFAALRRLDAEDLDGIIALPFPEEGLGRALNDRLRRAASCGA